MRRNFRILHIVGALDPGGVETWLFRVSRRIPLDKFQLDFCCLSGRPGFYGQEIEQQGGRIFTCQLSKNLASFTNDFANLLDREDYDIIHSHVHHFSGYILRIADKANIPIRIAHSHSTSDGGNSTLVRHLYRFVQKKLIHRHATHLVGVSAEAAEGLFGTGFISSSRLHIIPCGIELRPFEKHVDNCLVRNRLGIPQNATVIGHVGRFAAAKNHSFLLKIVKQSLSYNPNIWLLLVGTGPLYNDIKCKADELGLDSQVVMTGVRHDVEDLMQGAMDIFCLPSLREGLPVVAIEAQAAGLRCIVSDRVTRETTVVPGSVNYLPLEVSASVWARKVLELLSLGRVDSKYALQEIANRGFDIQSSVEHLTRLYTS